MSGKLRDQIDYTVFCVNAFARNSSLPYGQSFDYLCASVMEHEKVDMKEALQVVYDSKLYALMSDPETGLYREGPVYLYDMLCEERGAKRESMV